MQPFPVETRAGHLQAARWNILQGLVSPFSSENTGRGEEGGEGGGGGMRNRFAESCQP